MVAENIDQLEKIIDELGENLLQCEGNTKEDGYKCEGINNDKKEGIIPRCLFLETDSRGAFKEGCVVVGINPGKSNKNERNYYKNKEDINYKHVKEYSKLIIEGGKLYEGDKERKAHKYYNRTREFLEMINLKGPILWTELVKCENNGKKLPALQTFRICTKEHLTKEIECIPDKWPLIAVGNIAYNALSFLYPEKTVIGIPHPTGSYGYFDKLVDDTIKKNIIYDVKVSIENKKAIWLNYKNINGE